MTATVAELWYYPVKSCAGSRVRTTRVLATGLAQDRSFMLVDADGGVLTQRRAPALAALRPELNADGTRLLLRWPDGAEFDHPVRFAGEQLAVSVFVWAGTAVDQGDAVAEWLTSRLGMQCRLVRADAEHDRVAAGRHDSLLYFADSGALLVTSLSSLDGLNERILESGGDPVPMSRFRPNIVVRGWARAHTEDRVHTLTIGTAKLGFGKDCVRCAVPTVDQETGRKAGPEPIRTLASYRRAPDGGVTFGMKAAVLGEGEISEGDQLIVHDWS
ncbi:hypothetical protein EV191_103349 [Tamaricihabitans halophyticus]|uniref:MOSC domain-containing protein n=1 Tax=Tamaricihabitans halophyticus TaxID=1262583 RepID=A0A4R2QY41_9PSEU|nr:MOSC N-terminal beta barrel domain-containing protein [Tamaricihabitans halophyticus]TCP54304.1 hypothetical protein EV191_103349 [Tamaricihabitans halophyticus]